MVVRVCVCECRCNKCDTLRLSMFSFRVVWCSVCQNAINTFLRAWEPKFSPFHLYPTSCFSAQIHTHTHIRITFIHWFRFSWCNAFDRLLFLCVGNFVFIFFWGVFWFWISRTEHWIRLMIVRFPIAFCYTCMKVVCVCFFWYILCISILWRERCSNLIQSKEVDRENEERKSKKR